MAMNQKMNFWLHAPRRHIGKDNKTHRQRQLSLHILSIYILLSSILKKHHEDKKTVQEITNLSRKELATLLSVNPTTISRNNAMDTDTHTNIKLTRYGSVRTAKRLMSSLAAPEGQYLSINKNRLNNGR